MPRRSPFTLLCQQSAKLAFPTRVDLHAHTTASDGDWTASQLAVQALNERLDALAVTDHDTTNGVAEVITTAATFSRKIEIIPGIEVSTEHLGREYHLLAYFVDVTKAPLQTLLGTIRQRRRDRFQEYLAKFETLGAAIPPHLLAPLLGTDTSLGRRHLAKLLVAAGHAETHRDAFVKFILPNPAAGNHRAPLPEAVETIRNAGGVSSLAHPPNDFTFELFQEMAGFGLDAVEVNHPGVAFGFGEDLRGWAKSLALLTTGGSDCHGPDPGRPLGSRTVSLEVLAALRSRAGRTG